MPILIIVFSIVIITASAWAARRFLSLNICPICAGVAGTWLWALGGMMWGKLSAGDFELPVAILMGGSIVGIAYQVEKRLPPNRSSLLWKALFIPAGFVVVYSALQSLWLLLLGALALCLGLGIGFTRGRVSRSVSRDSEHRQRVDELEKKMKDCC